MKRKNLVILSGLPASGKSTWLHTHLGEGETYVSRDEVRFSIIDDNEDYFSHETEVFQKFIEKIEKNLDKGLRVFADATHINWASRRKLLEYIPDKDNIDIDVYVFNTSVYTCVERNKQREGRAKVPESAIHRMHSQFRHPMTDPFEYHQVIEIYTEGGLNVEYIYHTIGGEDDLGHFGLASGS